MEVGRGRELVGVVLIDLILTAPILTLDVYQEPDGLFTYRPVVTGFYVLERATTARRKQLMPSVHTLWFSEQMHAYYIQLKGRWGPSNVCEGSDWHPVDYLSG